MQPVLLQIHSFLCRFAANPFLFVFLVQQNPRLNSLDYLCLRRFSQGSSRFAAGPFLFVPLVPQNPRLDISITQCFQGFPQWFPYFLRSEVSPRGGPIARA
jgi:hypothetical protein